MWAESWWFKGPMCEWSFIIIYWLFEPLAESPQFQNTLLKMSNCISASSSTIHIKGTLKRGVILPGLLRDKSGKPNHVIRITQKKFRDFWFAQLQHTRNLTFQQSDLKLRAKSMWFRPQFKRLMCERGLIDCNRFTYEAIACSMF